MGYIIRSIHTTLRLWMQTLSAIHKPANGKGRHQRKNERKWSHERSQSSDFFPADYLPSYNDLSLPATFYWASAPFSTVHSSHNMTFYQLPSVVYIFESLILLKQATEVSYCSLLDMIVLKASNTLQGGKFLLVSHSWSLIQGSRVQDYQVNGLVKHPRRVISS